MYVLGAWADMKPEISAAVGFICKLLRTKAAVDERQLQTFCQSLQDLLAGGRKLEHPEETHTDTGIANKLLTDSLGFETGLLALVPHSL